MALTTEHSFPDKDFMLIYYINVYICDVNNFEVPFLQRAVPKL